MDGIAFLMIGAILFVLWLLMVAMSTGTLRIQRYKHRDGFYLGGRR